MAAAIAGPGTALRSNTQPTSSSSAELGCKRLPAAESPRCSRIELSLAVDKNAGYKPTAASSAECCCQALGGKDTYSAGSLSVLNFSSLELRSRDWDEPRRRNKVKLGQQGRRRPTRINAIAGDGSSHQRNTTAGSLFDVEDPRARAPPWRGSANQAWEVLRQDLQFCDWKARTDVLAIKTLHDKMVDVLNPMARDWKSIETLRGELSDLQQHLSKAHEQVHLSEARVSSALQKLAYFEALVNDKLLQDNHSGEVLQGQSDLHAVATEATMSRPPLQQKKSYGMNVSGPLQAYSPALKNFWYPVAFSADMKDDTMVPFECFEEPWVLFRGKDGRVGCLQNACAHRACPLHLGAVKEGRIQCPYHGWEYSTSGVCEKMPSTKPANVSIQSLPCIEQDGMVWIWPGDGIPAGTLPALESPDGFTTHAQIVMELPVEHGLLMENLLDLAHAPFTHTSTFAKGWPVPSLVRFCTPVAALQGPWDPYPIDMEFQPPCMVRSTIGISQPGKLEGKSTQNCTKHLHQLHVCVPSSRGKTRLLYRLSLNFYPILKHIPYIQFLWKHLANKVLDEDLRLVLGQQDRMIRGANVWNMPVSYDKLGVRYRRWRLAVEAEKEHLPFGRG